MEHKIWMIAGANSGIGKEAAIKMPQQGHQIISVCRSREKGEAPLRELKALTGNKLVELMVVGMVLQSSIKDLANTFEAKYKHLNVLIHHAVIFDVNQKKAVFTAEGIESLWAKNHLGPVLPKKLLWDALANSAHGCVITIATKGLMAKPFLKVDLEDPEFKKKSFGVENAYYQSKLAQIIYTNWLAKQGQESHITANCFRVPAVCVDIGKHNGLPSSLKKDNSFKSKFSPAPEKMADGYIYLEKAAELDNVTGIYSNEKMRPVNLGRYAQQVQEFANVMTLSMKYLN